MSAAGHDIVGVTVEVVCPNPGVWHRTFEHLTRVAAERGVREAPPKPLILGGWNFSNDLEKKARWDATVAWAKDHGLQNEIEVGDADYYRVDELYGGLIGPLGGPMYLSWRFESLPKPDRVVVESRLSALRERWRTIAPPEVTAVTEPRRITGTKGRRLELWVTDPSVVPPWGTWTSLARDERRRSFTNFRDAVNRCLSPHAVDHIDFVLERRSPTQ